MTTRLVSRHIDRIMSNKVNPHIMQGVASIYLPLAERYLDRILRNAKGFPKDLVYVGCTRCTPHEEYMEMTKDRNNKRTADLAESSIYMCRFEFRHPSTPDPIYRYLYLPYEENGIFKLGGTLYHFTPVITDKVISPSRDSIFVRLLKDKINFRRLYHSMIVDGNRETVHVVWANIYRRTRKSSDPQPTTGAESCLMHYILGKYGFTETFRKYAGFVPVIGNQEIDEESYPSDQWVICRSTEIRPTTYKGYFYSPTQIRIAVPVNCWDPKVQAMIAGFYYVVDHFPDRIKLKNVEDTSLWMILLGHIIWSGHYGESNLYTRLSEHYVSLNDYVDSITIEKLRDNNFHISDFYDLLDLLITHFNSMVLLNYGSNLSMYGKNLEVLYYAMYDITYGIFRAIFKLNKMQTKRSQSSNGGSLTPNDIREAFSKYMKTGSIFKLAGGKVIAEALSYPGDHLYPKITSKVVEQEGAINTGERGKKRRQVVGENQYLDVSMIESGSILYLAKTNPTPTNRLNPYCRFEIGTGTIIPNPELQPILNKTKEMLTGSIKPYSPSTS